MSALFRRQPTTIVTGLALLAALTACGLETRPTEVGSDPIGETRRDETGGLLFGTPLTLYSSEDDSSLDGGPGGGGIGVNAFLWRASLDTIDFMPLLSADPFGGVIITEWFQPPNALEERLKLNVFILDTVLRADAIRVSVFRQTRGGGGWQDAAVEEGLDRQLEDAILTRARELRIASAE
ncbi:MAG: DUF3576 domain-containing protein [Pseudomonadota bacterium]